MIQIRPNAAQELQRLLTKSAHPHRLIHLDVASGGCYEWTYCLTLADSYDPQEATTYTVADLVIAVPHRALPHLQGLTIDYGEDLMGGGFRFINPQAQQTCGCGNSFSLTPATAPDSTTTDAPPSTWQFPHLNH